MFKSNFYPVTLIKRMSLGGRYTYEVRYYNGFSMATKKFRFYFFANIFLKKCVRGRKKNFPNHIVLKSVDD